MSGDVEVEAPRPRPVSGGLWTLFSWLRRDERSSLESLSSVGSDRTAASFDFLGPTRYPGLAPLILPPPGPPTDSYRKRLRERNLRRQQERDLTLHRKYGLLRCDGVGNYNTFSLASVSNKEKNSANIERGRRANSECGQRRMVHVAGKRRAPPPPVITYNTITTSSLTRHSRKRPAPQPPVVGANKTKQPEKPVKKPNITDTTMNQHSDSDIKFNVSTSFKEKDQSKNDKVKNGKTREKSFLKLIFENKKRNSVVDTATEKVLSNISELDKQAAEIIRMKKMSLEENNNVSDNTCMLNSKEETWFCTKCLKKYNTSINSCYDCIEKTPNVSTQTENQSSNSTKKTENVDELKKMLKEMKNSIPKRPKHKSHSKNIPISDAYDIEYIDSPTLRIGTSRYIEDESLALESTASQKQLNSGKTNDVPMSQKLSSLLATEAVSVKQTESVVDSNTKYKASEQTTSTSNITLSVCQDSDTTSAERVNLKNNNLNTPLKISSLLNPMYIPKHSSAYAQSPRSRFFSQIESKTDARLDPLLTPVNTKTKAVVSTKDIKPLSVKDDSKGNLVIPPKVKVEANAVQFSDPLKASSVALINNFQKAEAPLKNEAPSTFQVLRVECQNKTVVTANNSIKAVCSPLVSKFEYEVKKSDETKLNAIDKCSQKRESSPKQASVILPAISQQQKGKIPLNRRTSDVSEASSSGKSSSFEHALLSEKQKAQNQYSKRREIIKQLEQSIAKGDEHAAADAAVKLAQLRLSCSVLSFSSQILGEPSSVNVISKQATSPLSFETTENVNTKNKTDFSTKANVGTQLSSKCSINKAINTELVKPTTSNCVTKTKLLQPSTARIGTAKSNGKEELPSNLCNPSANMVHINVWVEDRESARGPVSLLVRQHSTLGELRLSAASALGVPARLQRWVVGRTLCTDDTQPLATLAGIDLSAPFYLCLVESDTTKEIGVKVQHASPEVKTIEAGGEVYTELVQLERRALVPNTETFECGVCIEQCPAGQGTVLRDCAHAFCRDCLTHVVKHSEEPVVSCPATGCDGVLQEREIRALVSTEDYERWLQRSLAAAESATRNSFHCRTRDCNGWALCEPGVRRFPCPVCKHINCVPCQAIHEGETCEQYRSKLEKAENAVNSNHTDENTRALIDSLISKGEALECPECKTLITKKWGCDWVKCAACKTEICWVTRGRRWGPGGKGDTSAGCRCGVDGKRCHPSCGYCH